MFKKYKSTSFILIFLFSLILSGCDGHDSDYIPYTMKGMDVWVYNNNTDKEIYAGRVDGSYFSKDESLSNCSSYAYSIAAQNNLKDWSYICCTVTNSSDCATKVR